MAIYLLPIPKSGYVERPLRAVATSGSSTEYLSRPELHAASDELPGERPTKWKALQVKGVKGFMRWI
jgi:hypothetical protein